MFADKVSSTVGGDIDVATTVIYPVTYMSTKRLYTVLEEELKVA